MLSADMVGFYPRFEKVEQFCITTGDKDASEKMPLCLRNFLAVVGIHPGSLTARPLKNGGWKTTFLLEDLVYLRKCGLLVQSRPWTMDMLFPILKVSYQISCAFILSEQAKIAVALLGSTSTLQMYLWLNVCCGHVCLRQRNRLTSQHNPKVLMTLFLLG